MANFTTSADLIDDVLFRANEKTDGTSQFNTKALEYLNRAYQGIWTGGAELDPEINEKWYWLKNSDPGVITLLPQIDAGTVSVTNNSTSITFSTGPTPSVLGYNFKVATHADVFRVSSHTAGATAATLDSVFTGATNTAASYKLFLVEYSLQTDVLYLLNPMHLYRHTTLRTTRGEVEYMDLGDLKREFPLHEIRSGAPTHFALIDDRSGQRKVKFSHSGGTSSTDLIRVEYEFAVEPSDLTDDASSIPVVPRRYRKVLADWALSFLLLDKEDSKAGGVVTIAQRGLRAMALDNRRNWDRMGRNFGKVLTRQGQRDRFLAPLRTESGSIIG